jgi:hypothetical protein
VSVPPPAPPSGSWPPAPALPPAPDPALPPIPLPPIPLPATPPAPTIPPEPGAPGSEPSLSDPHASVAMQSKTEDSTRIIFMVTYVPGKRCATGRHSYSERLLALHLRAQPAAERVACWLAPTCEWIASPPQTAHSRGVLLCASSTERPHFGVVAFPSSRFARWERSPSNAEQCGTVAEDPQRPLQAEVDDGKNRITVVASPSDLSRSSSC